MSNSLGVTRSGAVSLVGHINWDLIKAQKQNSAASHFNCAGSAATAHSFQVHGECIALSFPHMASVAMNPSITQIVTSVRGVVGPEIGTVNIKEIVETLISNGFSSAVAESAAENLLFRQAHIVGVTTGSMNTDVPYADAVVGYMHRGQIGYTNIEHVVHRVGDILYASVPTTDELNAIDYRATQARGKVHEGAINLIYRKRTPKNRVQSACDDLVIYLTKPHLHRALIRSTCRASVAHMANTQALVNFALFCGIAGHGFINRSLGLAPVPISAFDPTKNLKIGSADRNTDVQRDVTGGTFAIRGDPTAPYAELRRALYRLPNERKMPEDGVTSANMLNVTESFTLEPILAVMTGLIQGSPSTESDKTSMFSGVVAERLRSDARLDAQTKDKNPRKGSFREKCMDFTEAFARTLLYGTDVATIAKSDPSAAFGAVIGTDGQVIRNIAMSGGYMSNTRRPNPHTEAGAWARAQQIMVPQGLAGMADIFNQQSRRDMGIATRNTEFAGSGGVLLTQMM